jgi:hypothetical protein
MAGDFTQMESMATEAGLAFSCPLRGRREFGNMPPQLRH